MLVRCTGEFGLYLDSRQTEWVLAAARDLRMTPDEVLRGALSLGLIHQIIDFEEGSRVLSSLGSREDRSGAGV